MVPVFDAPNLSIAAAIGLSAVVGFLTSDHAKEKGEKADNMTEAVFIAALRAIGVPALYLGVGYVVHLFM